MNPREFSNKFEVTLAESGTLPKGFGVLPDNLEDLPDKVRGHTMCFADRTYDQGEMISLNGLAYGIINP